MKNTMRSVTALMCMLGILAVASLSHAAKTPPSSAINVNTASADELTQIPGIGASKAQAIVAYRANAQFTSVNDLTNVKGIGEKLLAKIAPYVTVQQGGTGQANPGTAEKAVK